MLSKSGILSQLYYPLKFARKCVEFLGFDSPNSLRVLIYHDIAPNDYVNFEAQIRWLSLQWNIVSPEQFSAMKSGQEKITGKNLLITFDDGLISNRIVAENILNPLGIKALFFCVSDFINISDEKEVESFIMDRICLGWSVENVPSHWKNMKWDDLTALLEQGHTIGGHTKSHARLSEINSEFDLKNEIVASADLIESKLGIAIEHFAYTFGDLNSINQKALEVASKRFKYVYSGIRGNNIRGNNGIYRDAAAEQDNKMNYHVFSNSLLGSFLEGVADPLYYSKRKKFQEWNRVKIM